MLFFFLLVFSGDFIRCVQILSPKLYSSHYCSVYVQSRTKVIPWNKLWNPNQQASYLTVETIWEELYKSFVCDCTFDLGARAHFFDFISALLIVFADIWAHQVNNVTRSNLLGLDETWLWNVFTSSLFRNFQPFWIWMIIYEPDKCYLGVVFIVHFHTKLKLK